MTRLDHHPRVSIYVLIFAVVFALAAPAVTFLGYIVSQFGEEREREVGREGERLAAEIADRLEEEVRTLRTMLAVFASSGWLEEGRYDQMHHRARSALAGTGRYLLVLDERLNQLLNTRVRYGTPLGKTSDPASATHVLETGGTEVSNLFVGRVADETVFNVLRRADLPGGETRVLILTRNAADLDRLIAPRESVEGWSFAIFDGSGQVATRRLDPLAEEATPAACLDTVFGFQTAGQEGEQQYVFNRAVSDSSWRVCVWGSAERLLARTEKSWNAFFLITVLWFAATLLVAIILSAGVSRAISRTARVGEALDTGREVTLAPSFIAEVDDVRRSLARAAAERLRKEEELRLLLRETAHRAKNQIALAVALLTLSSRNADSVDELRSDLEERLVSLGRSVDMISGSNVQAAPIRELIKVQLSPFLAESEERLEAEGDEVMISQSAAQSLGLVLHELATNASKYGAWSRPEGTVRFEWRAEGDDLRMEWAENGAPVSPPERTGFGTSLVDALIQRTFSGTVDREFRQSGFFCRLVVPLAAVGAAPAAHPA